MSPGLVTQTCGEIGNCFPSDHTVPMIAISRSAGRSHDSREQATDRQPWRAERDRGNHHPGNRAAVGLGGTHTASSLSLLFHWLEWCSCAGPARNRRSIAVLELGPLAYARNKSGSISELGTGSWDDSGGQHPARAADDLGDCRRSTNHRRGCLFQPPPSRTTSVAGTPPLAKQKR